MSDNGQAKGKFLDKLIAFGEAAVVHIGRFVNHALKMVLGGTAVERIIRELQPTVDAINALEPEMMKLSDTELSAKTVEFRNRVARRSTIFSSRRSQSSARPPAGSRARRTRSATTTCSSSAASSSTRARSPR